MIDTSCIEQAEMLRYLERDLGEARAQAIAAHLRDCPECRRSAARLEGLIAALREPCEEHVGVDLVADVRSAIKRRSVEATLPRPARSRLLFVASCGALAAAAAVVFVLSDHRAGEALPAEFHSKGNASANAAAGAEEEGAPAISVYVSRGREAVPAAGAIKAADAVVIAYSNPGPNPFSHLSVFALDKEGTVYWYYPRYTTAGTDPEAIPIAAGAKDIVLQEQVQHALATGPLVVFGLFARAPVRVLAVEAWARDLVASGRWPLVPLAAAPAPPFTETFTSIVALEVRP